MDVVGLLPHNPIVSFVPGLDVAIDVIQSVDWDAIADAVKRYIDNPANTRMVGHRFGTDHGLIVSPFNAAYRVTSGDVRTLGGTTQFPPTPAKQMPVSVIEQSGAKRTLSFGPTSESKKMKVSRKSTAYRKKGKGRAGSLRKRSRKATGRRTRKRSAGQRKRNNKKVKKFKEVGPPRSAIFKCSQYGQAISAQNTMFVGHATALQTEMVYVFCAAVLKKLTTQMGYPMLNVLDEMGYFVAAGSKFSLRWKNSPESGSSAGVSSFTVVSTGTVSLWTDVINTWVGDLPVNNDQLQFLAADYTPPQVLGDPAPSNGVTHAYTNLNLERATFHFRSTSELKMQNRTVALLGQDEADNVGQCPLIARVYEGTGTGTTYSSGSVPQQTGWTAGASLVFAANADTGIIAGSGGVLNQFLSPPLARSFPNVKKSSEISITPGEIKISRIGFKKNFGMRRLASDLFGDALTATQRKLKPLGTFRFFCLHKLMDAVDTEGDIAVVVENQTDMVGWITTKKTEVTVKINVKGYIAAITP